MTGNKQPDNAKKKPATRKKAPAKQPAKKTRTYPPKAPKEPTKAAQLVKKRDKPGRPNAYTPENVDAVLMHIATGNSVNSLIREENEHLVSPATVYRWIWQHDEFREKYISAQTIRSFAVSEELFDIADDGSNDWMEKLDKEGEQVGWQINGENVQRSRLRAQVRQWHLERINGKIFGDKKQIDHGIPEESPLGALLQSVSGNTLKPKPQGDDS